MLVRILFLISLLILPMASYAGSDFSLVDTKGHAQKLSNYRGKWVLVNIWATWCPNCVSEMPELSKLSQAHKNIVVLGLATDGQDPKQVINFAKRFKASYPIIAGNEQQAQQLVNVQGYPTSLLYNPAGKLVAYKVGPVKQKDIESYISGRK
jgi:thiol-disulfide isomerase/thioredoxin